ncbi:OmpH family outer membrane protein [Prevotella sp. HUN102]|uniref:OmpH family outer membrane protein n=1 Tax=Prevotella sp. HUN102 TaxID=1392486 RepID=UPI00048B9B1F|nr:OmpH family outer membrane protein [Prevotella sp. HUN102]
MKKLFLMLMLCAPMTMFAQKFGHLDSQALLQSLPEATSVQQKLEAKGKEYEKQLTDMQAELQRKAEEYDKTKSTMNATKQAETEKALQDMYAKIQQTAQDNQRAFNEEQQKSLGPVLEKVRNAIAAVAKAGGYVYIMEKEAGQPLYINDAVSKDITAEVKAQLAKMK